MDWSPAWIYGLLAALANLLGGISVSAKPLVSQRVLKYLIAIGAGFMLAAVFIELIPASITVSGDSTKAMILVLAGYLAIQFFEHTIVGHFHFGEETHVHMVSKRTAFIALGGVAFHTFFDGISIASGFAFSSRLGLLIFMAVILHKLPEGFTIASIMIAAGQSRRAASLASAFIGLTTLLGTISIMVFKQATHYALPISAGVTLYIAASDLIPEVNKGEERRSIPLAVFGGALLYYSTDVLLSKFIH